MPIERRDFASDNTAGLTAEALAAITSANAGHVASYGDDAWTARAADGFVVTEPGLRILYANQAFARLVGLKAAGDVIGKSLTRWVGFSQEDLTTLTRQMETREAVSAIRTSLKPSPSKAPTRTVELTAVAVPDEPQRCFGFWVKDHGEPGPADANDLAHRQGD